MNELNPRARALIDRVGGADGPPAGTRERVRAGLGAALGAGAATTALGASASGKAGAAATGLWGLTGKSGATIVLCLLAGGAAGVAVTAPLAFFTGHTSSHALSRRATDPAERGAVPLGATTPATTVPASASAELIDESTPSTAAFQHPVREIETTRPRVARTGSPSDDLATSHPEQSPLPPVGDVTSQVASAMATELALLKSAQRELNAGNAEASLTLLDEHARRYPGGAFRVERLGARVFALCQLGRVESARAAASEFFAMAADSPLVPRVIASCGGPGTKGAR